MKIRQYVPKSINGREIKGNPDGCVAACIYGALNDLMKMNIT